MTPRSIIITAAVMQATVQDRGRSGYAHLGVGGSGAVDLRQYQLANRLVGNADGAPAIEYLAVGPPLVFEARGNLSMATAGATGGVTINERSYWSHQEIAVADGSRVRIDASMSGMYRYIAFRGGLAAAQTLGSVSTDLLSGLGEAPLTPGRRLPIGQDQRHYRPVDTVPLAAPREIVRLQITPGPRDDWFESLKPLLDHPYIVSERSNRIGLRLVGPPLKRCVGGELPSEGISAGAIQVPPDGLPIVFLADHPVTGGYPVAAVVEEGDLGFAAQARIGHLVSFVL